MAGVTQHDISIFSLLYSPTDHVVYCISHISHNERMVPRHSYIQNYYTLEVLFGKYDRRRSGTAPENTKCFVKQFVPHLLVFRGGFSVIEVTETLYVFLTSPITYRYENGKAV
jgi:hypothetical protein